MADIAISYSHMNTDLAESLRRRAIERGFSVWMDNADGNHDGMESIAIPWGQSHWDVISQEFIRASVVIAIDTPQWRESEYCRSELAFLEEWGKWVALLPTGQLPVDPSRSYRSCDEILDTLNERATLANAHARLAEEIYTEKPRSNASKLDLFLPTARSRDARLMLSPDLARFGLSLPPKLEEATRTSVEHADAAHRRVVRVRAGGLVILSRLVVVSVISWFLAESGRKAAEIAADESAALALAAQSVAATNTLTSIDLAQRALARSDTSAARSALSVARANDARMRSIQIDQADYQGASVSADGSVLVAYTSTVITFFDAHSGQTRSRIDTPKAIVIGGLAVSADGGTVVFISTEDGSVWSATQVDGAHMISAVDAEGLSTPDGINVWWIDSNLQLTTMPFFAARSASSRSEQVSYRLPSLARAFSVDAVSGTVDLVGSDGLVRSGYLDAFAFIQTSEFRVQPTEDVGRRKARNSSAQIIRCSGHIHGYLRGQTVSGDVRFSVVEGSIRTEKTAFATGFPPVCQDGGDAWFTLWVGGDLVYTFESGSRPILPKGASRYVVASTIAGGITAVVTTDGRLLYPGREGTRLTNARAATALIPLDSGSLAINKDGEVSREADSAVTGSIGGAIAPVTVSTIGDVAMVFSQAGVVRLDPTGIPQNVFPISSNSLRSMRASSDGDHFVVATTKSVTVLDRDGRSTRSIALPWLGDKDSVNDADTSPDGRTLAVSTVRGRIASIDLSSDTLDARFWNRVLPTGTATKLAYSATTGNILVAPPDGIMVALDDQLNVVNSLYLGASTHTLTIASKFALVASDALEISVVDTTTLEIGDIGRDVVMDIASTRLNTSADSIIGLAHNGVDAEGSSVRVRVPLSTTK